MSLSDMFTSPVRAPPRPRSPSRTPSPSPGRSNVFGGEALFLSPGSHASPSRPAPNQARASTSYRQERAGDDLLWDADAAADTLPILPPALASVQPYDDRLHASTSMRAGAGVGAGAYGLDLGETFDPLAPLNGPGAEDEDGQPAKKKRIVPKIDAERLMGDRGLPALMKRAKKFKPRGKGHEAHDLKDLMAVYQIWAHGMFPKGDFKSTILRTENVCRTRRMESAIKGYREAFYPPPSPEPQARPTDLGGLTPPESEDEAGSASPSRVRSRFSPTRYAESHNDDAIEDLDDLLGAGQSDRRGRPEADTRDDDGPDMDELMAMEEMEREAEARTTGSTRAVEGLRKDAAKDGEEEDGPPEITEEDEW